MKKILVTGGAGYIGSHALIEISADPELEAVSVDNFMNSGPDTFKRIEAICGKKIFNHNIDLCDAKAVNALFEKEKDIYAVMHFAALKSVPQSVADPDLYYHNNNESLNNILIACSRFGVKYFIFSSSCSVYGNIKSLPVNEQTPLGKYESPYGHTKQMGEEMVKAFAKNNSGTKCVSLRYFNPVGAHLSGLIGELPNKPPENLVPVITRTAIGKFKETVVFGNDYPTRDGTCIRDYVHVCDIADAHVKALKFLERKTDKENYFVFNLGTGNGVSVLEAIHSFEKVSGQKLNYRIGARREGDVVAIYSDPSLAKKELGWDIRYSIDEMMASAWKWEEHFAAQE